jgi:hypothetical protein
MKDWQPKLESLFCGAMQLLSPAQRDDYLNHFCKNDPTLREEIRKLLSVAGSPGRLSEAGAPPGLPETPLNDGPRPDAAACPPPPPPALTVKRTRILQSGGGGRIPTFNSEGSGILHPRTAQGGWELDSLVWDDGAAGIAIGLFRLEEQNLAGEKYATIALGLRWAPSGGYSGKDGQKVIIESAMGGETEWFILPFTFGAAMGRTLINLQAAGLANFGETGYRKMVDWLIDCGEVSNALSY